jgi:hypothetical protein
MAQEALEAPADKNWLSVELEDTADPVFWLALEDPSPLTLARMMSSVGHSGLLMDWCNQADAARISKTDHDRRRRKLWRSPSAY